MAAHSLHTSSSLALSSHSLVQDLLDLGAGADGKEQGPGLEGVAVQSLEQGAVVGGDRAALLQAGSAKDALQAGETGNQILGQERV